MSQPLRYRFCPAPSGWLHVGGARTALFNWLAARQSGGAFVLRIEDTDAERATLESAALMMDALEWLGLTWDEGPAIGGHAERGAHGPYLQSLRRPLHEAVARGLLEAGAAYESFESPEELEQMRDLAQASNTPVAWAHRDLDEAGRAHLRAEGRTPVLRVRTPDEGSVTFDDAVRGRVEFRWAEVPDFVIVRADGSPTYMLANVVDDLAQGIGYVVRGEDLLSATPRQILLTERLLATGVLEAALAATGHPSRDPAWPSELRYAHLPLLVGEDRKKLSKRHGDVAIEAFSTAGILPDAMVNFLALCGWAHDGERERFTVAELVELFRLDRVRSSPAFFDTVKLRSLNADAIRALPDADLADRLVPVLQRAGLVEDPAPADVVARVASLAPLVRERIQVLDDALPFIAFAFTDVVEVDEAAAAKWLGPAAGPVLDAVLPRLESLGTWDADSILGVFTGVVGELGIGMGKAMQPVRVVLTGSAVSPPLPETLAVLDREWALERIRSGRRRVAGA